MHESMPSPEWLKDPDKLVFASDETLAVGASEEHGLGDVLGNVFPRGREAVREDWQLRVGQIRSLLEGMQVDAGSYVLDEVTFELGFSAQGQVVFVAQAGVTTTIRVTFTRADAPR